MPIRRNAKRKRYKRATAAALRKKRYRPKKTVSMSTVRKLCRSPSKPFEDRSRPLVERCPFCSNKSDEGNGTWVCAPCLAKLALTIDTPLGLATWGIETGIDYWVDGNWILTGMLVDKYARRPSRRWRW